MKQPKLLDLFCCAGGASAGYAAAGFDVTGVDHKPQPHYPFAFVRDDALAYGRAHARSFDVIHASPPCQRFSRANRGLGNTEKFPDHLPAVRKLLYDSGKPFVIENVPGAPLIVPFMLCGSMFGLRSSTGLWLRRHRIFECSEMILAPQCRHPKGPSIGVYGNGTNSYHRQVLGRNISTDEQREAMGIDWMPREKLTQAIPPAYTKWIGAKLLERCCT